jgi:GTP-binding protein HflX
MSWELACYMAELSRETNRQIGILINRKGKIVYVIVGDQQGIIIPDLSNFRSGLSRLKGLRLIHTHLKDVSLSQDDFNDLVLLRLDSILAFLVNSKGEPTQVEMAHLLPQNPKGKKWLIFNYRGILDIDLNFSSFISFLEDELSKNSKTKNGLLSKESAILVGLTNDSVKKAVESLDELKDLAHSARINVLESMVQVNRNLSQRFLLSKGKLSELLTKILQTGADFIILDQELNPSQAKHLTDLLDVKVIDRTQLILDIFAQRAKSRDGKIQVELAQLKYLLPRLSEREASLSRLTGGIGARGPGETKLEIDRRKVRDKIARLEKEIKSLQKGRNLRRIKREKTEMPIIAIIGYTNAGKSTLLNTLTKSHTFVENKLFATLDPISRRLRFPRDTEAIINDTVGFIQDLPKDLFNAFKATLEELGSADVLIHLIDISSKNFKKHIIACEKIVDELGYSKTPLIQVFNKTDLFKDKEILHNLCEIYKAVPICANNKNTLLHLIKLLESMLIKIGKQKLEKNSTFYKSVSKG